MFRFIVENPLSLQKFILWRKKPVNVYNSSDFLTIKILRRRWYNRKYHRIHCDTHPILRSGYAAILFRWGNTTCALWCMFYADKPRRSEKSRDISWATRIGEKHTAPGFTVPMLNMHKLYWPSKNKMAAYLLLRIGWVSQRIQRYLRLFHLRQYFKGKKIRRILKLYGLFLHKMIFVVGANGSLPRFFQTCDHRNSWRQNIG